MRGEFDPPADLPNTERQQVRWVGWVGGRKWVARPVAHLAG